MNVSLIYNYKD